MGLEADVAVKEKRIKKFKDAYNIDISELEKSYLDDDDHFDTTSNFSFKGGSSRFNKNTMNNQEIAQTNEHINDLKEDLAALLRKYKEIESENEILEENLEN